MIGNHSILKTLTEILRNNGLISEINNGEDLFNFFYYINENKQKFNNSFLLNYLYKNISNEDVSKRKTTARDFEDFLGIVLGGLITDETNRSNNRYNTMFVENDFITSFVKSNKREKIDIEFQDYGLSVKTLMYNNKEINFGSFEKKALFYDFGINEYLDERKGKTGIGLGSKPQLNKLLGIIESNGEFERFRERFLSMFKNIFSDDILIAIKNDLIMDVYITNGNDFYKLLEDNSSNKEDLLSIINRWEGNSIRMDRTKILNISKHVRLDFNFLTTSIITKIEETEGKISKYIIYYINDFTNKQKYKNLIINECNTILDEIDKDIYILN